MASARLKHSLERTVQDKVSGFGGRPGTVGSPHCVGFVARPLNLGIR
jgi:hypothetical protein